MSKNSRTPALLTAVLISGAMMFASATQAAAQIETRTLRLSGSNSKTHPSSIGAEQFAKILGEKTKGKFTVKVYLNGVLGPDLQGISALQGGTLDMMYGTPNLLAGNVKEFAAFDLPFLFNSYEEADAIIDGPIGQQLFDKLEQRGIIGLTYLEFGFRHFHNRGEPIRTAEDFVGKKLRVQPSAVYVDLVNALGANATPMSYTEVFPALDQGAIDGLSNPLINILDGKYYDISKNLTLTYHVYQPAWIGMSKKTWDKLSDEEKALVKEAAREAALHQRKIARDMAEESVGKLKDLGMMVTILPDEEMMKMREKVKPVVEKHTLNIGPEFVGALQDHIEAYRSGKR